MTVGGAEPDRVLEPPTDPPDEVDESASDSTLLGSAEYHELLPERGPFRPILKAVGKIEQAVGAALIVVILVLVLIQVTQRYTPFGGWPWTGEVARLALVWCTFVLSGYLMAQDRHITIRAIDLVLHERALGVVKLLSHVVVAATCLGMGYATYRLIADDIGQRTPAAEIPVSWVYVLPLIGFFLTALRAIMVIVLVDIREMARGREEAA
jgi:TRAP-type C4-dicarboxylate transport system permease small subunit